MTFTFTNKKFSSSNVWVLTTASLILLCFSGGLVEARSSQTAVTTALEAAKGSRPELVHFLQDFPKGADLHNHLDGSVFSEHALGSAREQGLNYDLIANGFTNDQLGENVISLDAMTRSAVHFRAFREAFSLRAWKQVSGSGRDQFFNVFGRIASSKIYPGEMLRNVIRQANLQLIQHLELIAPVVPADVISKFNSSLVNFDINDLDNAYAQIENLIGDQNVKSSVQQLINDWEKVGLSEVNEQPNSASVRYIGYVNRLTGLRDFFLAAATNFSAVNADSRIVSLTLVFPEDLPIAVADFENQMKILDFLWQKMGQPNISLHAGELNLEDATLDVLKDRIAKSINIGHSRRIGHGASIAWEKNAAELLKQMAENKILVEICLSSNEAILDIKGRDHPFDLYRKYQVPISLNTDDEGISRSPLTMEFVKAIEAYNLAYSDLVELARNSLEYSFLSGTSLFEDGNYQKPIMQFKRHDFRSSSLNEEQQALMASNPKLKSQVTFEQLLRDFEAKFP